jgi:hypothetical protein
MTCRTNAARIWYSRGRVNLLLHDLCDWSSGDAPLGAPSRAAPPRCSTEIHRNSLHGPAEVGGRPVREVDERPPTPPIGGHVDASCARLAAIPIQASEFCVLRRPAQASLLDSVDIDEEASCPVHHLS